MQSLRAGPPGQTLPVPPTLRNFYAEASHSHDTLKLYRHSLSPTEDKVSAKSATPHVVSVAHISSYNTSLPVTSQWSPRSGMREVECFDDFGRSSPRSKAIPRVLYQCSAAISVAVRDGKWKEALRLLREMKGPELKGQALCATNYQAVVGACARHSAWGRVVELINEMGRLRLQADPESYTSAIISCEVLGRWEPAVAFLREMWATPDIRITPNLEAYNSAIAVCSRNAQWQQALELLREIPDVALCCNSTSYNAAIRACQRGDQWDRAVQLLEEMWDFPDLGLLPDVHSYNAVLEACGQAAKWSMALHLLRQMPEQAISQDAASYAYAVRACEMAENWKSAVELLREMQTSDVGLVPTLRTYNAVVKSCAAAGQWEVALHLFWKMPDTDVDSFKAALVACAKSKSGELWSLALQLLSALRKMRKTGFGPDRTSYHAAMCACKAAGFSKKAIGLFQEMLQVHIAPDIHCCNTALGTYKRGNRWQFALGLLDRMDRMYRIRPSVESYKAVMEACGAEWETAMCLLQEMQWNALEPNISCLNAAIVACENGEAWDQAIRLFNERSLAQWQHNN